MPSASLWARYYRVVSWLDSVVTLPRVVVGRAVLAVSLLWCVHPEMASSQGRRPPQGIEWPRSDEIRLLTSLQQTVPEASSDLTNSVLIAAIGSATGLLVGGFLGYSIDRARDVPSDVPGLGGLIYGALAASALLSPSLLYVANDRQGPWGRAVLLSVAGTAFAALAFRDLDQGLIVGPAIQIGVSVALLH